MEPMLLEPVGKDYIWGGTRLKSEYGKDIGLTPLAETWECSAHPDGPSRIVNGEFAGKALDEVLREDLSVQVHPDDAYAMEHEGQNGKSELWYVLDAEPGASIICGFAHPVTREILHTALKTRSFAKHLQKIPIKKGDAFYIPAGTIHALGAGTLIVEIQESSNVTYRVYDYDRVDKDGNKRPLQFNKALDVLDMNPASQSRQQPRLVKCRPGYSKEYLCRCRHFEAEWFHVSDEYSFTVSDGTFQVLLCVEGKLTLKNMESKWDIKKGQCLFMPAGMGESMISGVGGGFKITC